MAWLTSFFAFSPFDSPRRGHEVSPTLKSNALLSLDEQGSLSNSKLRKRHSSIILPQKPPDDSSLLRETPVVDDKKVIGTIAVDADRQEDREVRHKFGQTFYWQSSQHYEARELEPYRQIGDVDMDCILKLCSSKECGGMRGAGRFDDIVTIAAQAYANKSTNSAAEVALANFYDHYCNHVPKWVDWDQLQRGIDFFITYTPVAIMSLFYRSLVGGFSIPKITAVLIETKYLAPPSSSDKVLERLSDTGGFMTCFLVSDDNESPSLPASSLRPGKRGWAMALRVRALHAKVRQAILSRKKWDSDHYGIPINQEDMAGTLLAFSVNVLKGIEFVAGKPLSEKEQLDYLALWRYLGWLLGVNTVETNCHRDEGNMERDSSSLRRNVAKTDSLPPIDPCGERKFGNMTSDPILHSAATLESIWFHLLNLDESSIAIAHHLLRIGDARGHLNETKQKVDSSSNNNNNVDEKKTLRAFNFRGMMCRRFLGDPLADALKLPSKSDGTWTMWWYYHLATFWLLVLRVYTLCAMRFPWIRKIVYKWHMNGMIKMHGIWTTDHDLRVRKSAEKASAKLSSGKKFSPSSSITTRDIDENISTLDNGSPVHSDGNASKGQESMCPFAFIMPPQ